MHNSGSTPLSAVSCSPPPGGLQPPRTPPEARLRRPAPDALFGVVPGGGSPPRRGRAGSC
eukprot:10886842-Alexandrium_andersonii.AAC.1